MILKDYTCMSVSCITVWTNVACNKENFTQSCFLHVASRDWDGWKQTTICLLAKARAPVAASLSGCLCLQLLLLWFSVMSSLPPWIAETARRLAKQRSVLWWDVLGRGGRRWELRGLQPSEPAEACCPLDQGPGCGCAVASLQIVLSASVGCSLHYFFLHQASFRHSFKIATAGFLFSPATACSLLGRVFSSVTGWP